MYLFSPIIHLAFLLNDWYHKYWEVGIIFYNRVIKYANRGGQAEYLWFYL